MFENIEIDFIEELTVDDMRFAQASCQFTCITCSHEVIYSSLVTGREDFECDKCQRVYKIDSVVFNQTYDKNFKMDEDVEEVKIWRVFTSLSNSRRFLSGENI
jgi:NAD-dependent SIR2 family protein deacetylase